MSVRSRIIFWCSTSANPGNAAACLSVSAAESGNAGHAHLRSVQRRRCIHHGERHADPGARPVRRRFRRHHLSKDDRLLQLQCVGSFPASHQPLVRPVGRLYLQQVTGRFIQPVGAGLSVRSRVDESHLRFRYAAQLRSQLSLSASIRQPVRRAQPVEQRLVAVRHHAHLQRTAGHALQQHRQLAAGIHAQRHQQQWRGYA